MRRHNPWAADCRLRDGRTPDPCAICRKCRKGVKGVSR